MGRINPTVTKEAESIYNALPHHKRGEFVSDAIITKHAQDSGEGLEARVEKLEKAVEGIKKVIMDE